MNTKLQLCIMLLTFILFSNLLFAQDAQNIDPLNPCGFSKTVDQATLERKLKILQEVGNKSIEDNNCQASILIKLAKINANNLQIEVALSNYNKAFKILDSLHNNDLLRLLTSNRGDMLLNLGDLKASRKDFKASLHYIKESEYKQRKSIAYINISATFDKNQGDSIIYYANKAVDTYQDTDNVRLRVNIYNNLSWGYLLNNQPEKALSILEKNVDRSILSKEVLGLLYPAVMHTMGKIYQRNC